jgi:hypothetical protein
MRNISILILLVFLFSLMPVNAAESINEELTLDVYAMEGDPGILPGNPFYGMKLAAEDLSVAFTFDEVKKTEKNLGFANKRLLEAKALSEKGDLDGVERAKEEHSQILQKVKFQIETLSKSDNHEDNLKAELKFEKELEKHEEKVLSFENIVEVKIKRELNAEQQSRLDAFFASLKEDTQNVKSEVGIKKEETKNSYMLEESISKGEVEKRIKIFEKDVGVEINDKGRALKDLRQADAAIVDAKIKVDNVRDRLCFNECNTVEKGADFCVEKCLTPSTGNSKSSSLITANVVATDEVCEVTSGTPTRDRYWERLGLDTSAHPDIDYYRIKWFSGSWSKWYETGVDDKDWKTNYDGTERRVWSYFTDHYWEYKTCDDVVIEPEPINDTPEKTPADLMLYSIEVDQNNDYQASLYGLYNSVGDRFVLMESVIKNLGETTSGTYSVMMYLDNVYKQTKYFYDGLEYFETYGPAGTGQGYYLSSGEHTVKFAVNHNGDEPDATNNELSKTFIVEGQIINVTLLDDLVVNVTEPEVPVNETDDNDDEDEPEEDYSTECGDDEEQTICHQPGTNAEQTKSVPASAIEGHLGHGDYCGECVVEPEIETLVKQDKSLTFHLTFDDTLISVDGEQPTRYVGSIDYSENAVSGGALTNMGDREYVEYLCEGNFNYKEGAVSAWIYFDEFTSEDSVIWHTDDSKFVLYYDYGATNGYKKIKARAGGEYNSEAYYEFDERDKPTNELNTWEGSGWHFVAMTWKGAPAGIAKIFVDGHLKSTKNYLSAEDCYTFRVGNNYGSWMGWHDGQIDELKMYNYAVPPGQLLQEYNSYEVPNIVVPEVVECPLLIPPAKDFCSNGTLETRYDDAGCVSGFVCEVELEVEDLPSEFSCNEECLTDECEDECETLNEELEDVFEEEVELVEEFEDLQKETLRSYEELKTTKKVESEDAVSELRKNLAVAEELLSDSIDFYRLALSFFESGDYDLSSDAARRSYEYSKDVAEVLS